MSFDLKKMQSTAPHRPFSHTHALHPLPFKFVRPNHPITAPFRPGTHQNRPHASASPSNPSVTNLAATLASTVSNYFPIVVLSSALLGIFRPTTLTHIPAAWMSPFLGLSMLGMGLTLTFADFKVRGTRYAVCGVRFFISSRGCH